eukprot:9626353-Lingulodinium_polyedra.AAC.1
MGFHGVLEIGRQNPRGRKHEPGTPDLAPLTFGAGGQHVSLVKDAGQIGIPRGHRAPSGVE